MELSFGYEEWRKKNYDFVARQIAIPYSIPNETDRIVIFDILLKNGRYPMGLNLECKNQDSSGTAIEKIAKIALVGSYQYRKWGLKTLTIYSGKEFENQRAKDEIAFYKAEAFETPEALNSWSLGLKSYLEFIQMLESGFFNNA